MQLNRTTQKELQIEPETVERKEVTASSHSPVFHELSNVTLDHQNFTQLNFTKFIFALMFSISFDDIFAFLDSK